ncbi:hypothetical protein HEN05_008640, partial [Escherichia coli]|nr:hypothetical protein [Escherichia coli]
LSYRILDSGPDGTQTTLTIALTKLSLNISPDDRVKIVVTVSDGQSLHLSQQWPPSSEKS